MTITDLFDKLFCMNKNLYKKCQRCGKKCVIDADRCDNCGLIFERLKRASNEAGKKAIKNKEYNKVVYTSDLPKDVSKIRLLLLSIFLGFLGIHYAKVGRYKMFVFTLVSFFLLFVYTVLTFLPSIPDEIFTDKYIGLILLLMTFPAGFAAIIWLVSIFQIIFNKFKVPVSIDENYVVENLDKKVAEDILKSVKAQRQENATKTKANRKKKRFFCENCGQYVKLEKGDNVCPICKEQLKEKENE